MNMAVDLLGVGLGPFNLGLAALLSKYPQFKSVFVERQNGFSWHQGMLLPGATLQVPFLADLVSMADPTHPMSFLNYLHLNDRLYAFMYLDRSLVFRSEYNHYCQWVAQQLDNCSFSEELVRISYDKTTEVFRSKTIKDSTAKYYDSQNIVIGIGTRPYIPSCFLKLRHPLITHSANFLTCWERLVECRNVTIVGGGQSAAECVLFLLSKMTPERLVRGDTIRWITRSPGFNPMEFSKLGQECFTPAYMSYFQQLERNVRHSLADSQGQLYKGISFYTIADIFDKIYEQSVGGGRHCLSLYSSTAVVDVELFNKSGVECFGLLVEHRDLKQKVILETDAVVLATGYKQIWPEWFESLKEDILLTDEYGDFIVNDDGSLMFKENLKGKVFVQNAEVYHQGVGSPDLGLAAYRNAIIVNKLLGGKYYYVTPPKKTAFQNFGLVT
ncbi:L-lysine 6-monooxygenase [Oligella urethralis]|uniref:SidA/IucD/PvdA family monooxygenase n=1 Tax=Oligella urethralis TaxID=90245 RepID=UPI000E00161D|nr:SidA/IucD/PvdA family monooxygenase [Oligella urethralis]SUA60383.1 L-lysine 6-monooxygenase [Oligella urethralis]